MLACSWLSIVLCIFKEVIVTRNGLVGIRGEEFLCRTWLLLIFSRRGTALVSVFCNKINYVVLLTDFSVFSTKIQIRFCFV